MASTSDDSTPEVPQPPGKLRTWWHPLLVRLLDMELRGAYEVRDEVNVGVMPLRVDIVLIRRRDGRLPESAARELSALVKCLNQFTLIEFKGPTDSLETGDLDYLFGCAHLFRAQQRQPIHHTELTLIVLAPSLNQAVLDDLARSGMTADEDEPGIHRINGPVFTTWLIETDRITGPDEPVLSLFSRVFLRERQRIMDEISRQGFQHVLMYVLQQVQQFQRAGEGFGMSHSDVEVMNRVTDELVASVLQAIPAEDRVRGISTKEILSNISAEEILSNVSTEEILSRVSTEDRLRGLSADDILRRLSAEDVLLGLSKDELKRLRALLDQEKEES
jgi:hypothetical protein